MTKGSKQNQPQPGPFLTRTGQNSPKLSPVQSNGTSQKNAEPQPAID